MSRKTDDRPSKVVTGSRRLANQTRASSGPSVKLLSPADWQAQQPVPPDGRFGAAGRILPLAGYDLGMPPPALPPDAAGWQVQRLDAADTVDHVVAMMKGHIKASPITLARMLRPVIGWLNAFEGESWEERWLASGADCAPRSWRQEVVDSMGVAHRQVVGATTALLVCRVIRPSYAWMLSSRSGAHLPALVLGINDPAGLGQLRTLPAHREALPRHQMDAEACLSRILIRTGGMLEDIRGEQLLHYADLVKASGRHRREHLAWELMVALGPLADEPPTLRAAWSAKGNSRQHSVATLVDRYGIPPSPVRDLLVDYLGELKPAMDYASLEGVSYRLVRLFWWEVLQINPDQTDLRLDAETVTAWRERLAVTTDGRPRRETHSVLFVIRALYRDLAEWSHDEPARWGVWVAPCPVPKRESAGAAKEKRRRQARMQSRTRALTPMLPTLVKEACGRKDWAARLLAAAAEAAEHGEIFEIDGARYRRHAVPVSTRYSTRSQVWADVAHAPPGTRPVELADGLVNVSRIEADAFWGWAIVETLRHTGIRIEELQELTQLSLRHYTSQTTGTVVPLLHITPSKTDIERLIPMSPELVKVLLAVQRRAKGGRSQIPLSSLYDSGEKLHGSPFPHLFARRVGSRQEVVSRHYIAAVLGRLAAYAGLTDGGEPIKFTPHDFRRLFTTELVGSGLPIHIVSNLLGHLNVETTRGYTAVFPEHLVAAHQAFIERRRALRPDGEMRSATEQEWNEFEEHFLLRKVALGECHRPYGTPCVHEHACERCRFLRVDPAQLSRIEDMTCNARSRLDEARGRAWLGEVAALEESLCHLRRRRAEAQAQLDKTRTDDALA